MIRTLDARAVEQLTEEALASVRGRAHLLLHDGPDDALHEMLVAARASSYVRPHQHLRRVESLLVVSGEVTLVLFDDGGTVDTHTTLRPAGSGRTFFARLEPQRWHTLLFGTDNAVFLECKPGPYVQQETLFAPWSPEEEDAEGVRAFLATLARARLESPPG